MQNATKENAKNTGCSGERTLLYSREVTYDLFSYTPYTPSTILPYLYKPHISNLIPTLA